MSSLKGLFGFHFPALAPKAPAGHTLAPAGAPASPSLPAGLYQHWPQGPGARGPQCGTTLLTLSLTSAHISSKSALEKELGLIM